MLLPIETLTNDKRQPLTHNYNGHETFKTDSNNFLTIFSHIFYFLLGRVVPEKQNKKEWHFCNFTRWTAVDRLLTEINSPTDNKDYPLSPAGRLHLCHLQLLFCFKEVIENTATVLFMEHFLYLSSLKGYSGFSTC